MTRTDRKTLEKTRMRVLAFLANRATEKPGQGTSLGSMARALTLTESRVRHACKALQKEGLLVREACFGEDGGQRANRYIVTPLGHKALQRFRTNRPDNRLASQGDRCA